MRSQSLGLIAISAVTLLGSVSAEAQPRKEHFANLKYKDFDYPPRAHAHALKDNQVDLGYEIHEAQVDNGKFLAFRNIPYAEPPTTDKTRFMPPESPQTISEQVNNGSVDHKCPQAQVGWVPFAQEFLQSFGDLLDPKWRSRINPEDYGDMPDPIEGVIVWIYGGGYIFGWKDQYGSPAGLFDAASEDDYGNMIYVAMNYRLGALGWLGGPQFMADGGTPNLGLHDQKFAMTWVQRYIEQFGGNPTRITVMGQSAGASSILHHITAGEGNKEYTPVFDKAIIQSAGFFPQPDPTHDDRNYQRYLDLTGARDLQELSQLNTSVLQDANEMMTFESPYGIFNFGPTVDGDFVTDLPGNLLADNKNHDGIPLMVGHMAYDGLLFTPPWIRTNTQLREHSAKLYPGIPGSVKTKITELYPINWWIELAQKKIAVVSDFLDDIAIQCNSYYLTEAAMTARNPAPIYRYSFNALPAIHGYDTGYTYYPSPSPMGEADETLAKFFQKSIVNFARSGYPDLDAAEEDRWEMYQENRKVMNFGKPGQAEPDFTYAMGDDLMDRDKCAYWQSAPYYVATEGKETQFAEQEELK
ncbi:hypothetical protein IFR05_006258 [Cadophora sp. M221]|nr:hypothetical protein IFR05_006258 [Cadophora sp. M221]